MTFVIRPVQPGDRPALLALFAEAYGHAAPPEEWVWKYDRNPRRAVSVIALDGERTVGHFGAFGTRFRGAKGDLAGTSGGDVMTAPSVRALGRQNVYRRICAAFVRENLANGVPFTFGFPHERARLIGERTMGYRPVERVHQVARPLFKLRGLSKARRRLFRRASSEPFGKGHAPLAEEVHARSGWRTDRSADVLRWRFQERPFVTYRVVELLDPLGRSRAYSVARAEGPLGRLVDLQVAREEGGELGDLLDATSEALAPEGITTLSVRLPREGLLAKRLKEELGFAEHESDCFFEVIPFDPAFDVEGEAKRFDYRYSDHDVF